MAVMHVPAALPRQVRNDPLGNTGVGQTIEATENSERLIDPSVKALRRNHIQLVRLGGLLL
jgi:hypothetical protein